MGFGFDSIKKKKKKEIARWVPIERNSDFKRVESTSPVFFGFGNPERLIRRVYGVKLSTIQTSPVTRLFLPFVVRFQRFENWKRHERKIRGEGKSRGEKGERGGREREKERGIFVIRKSKLRPSRTIAVARVPWDLWFNAFSFADFNSRASPTSRPKYFPPRETRFYPALHARDITVAFKLEKERGRGNRKVNGGRERTNESERKKKREKEKETNGRKGNPVELGFLS